MKIEPKDIRVGDRVTVTGTVATVYGNGEVRATISITQKDLARAEITRPPQPPEGGDTIGLNGWDEEFRVVSLDDDGPWVVPSHRPSAVPVKVPHRGVRR